MNLERRRQRRDKKARDFSIPGGVTTIEAMEGDDIPCPILRLDAYDGGLLHVGMEYPVVLELSGITPYSDQIPYLINHDEERESLGHVENMDTNSRLTAMAYLSVPGEERSKMVEAMQAGKRYEASIGARSKLRLIPDGETLQANQQEFTGPVLYGAKSVLREVSRVNLGGADRATRTDLIAASYEGTDMFEEFLAGLGVDPESISDAQRASFQQLFDMQQGEAEAAESAGDVATAVAEPPASAAEPEAVATAASGGVNSRNIRATMDFTDIRAQGEAEVKAQREKVAAEKKRIRQVNAICEEYGNPQIKIEGAMVPLDEYAVEKGMDEKDVLIAAMRAARPAPAFSINTGASVDNYDAQAVEAAALMLFLPDEKWVAATFRGCSDQRRQQIMNNAMDSRYSQPTLSSIGHACIQANGTNQHFQIGKTDDRFLQATLDADSRARAVTVQANATGTSTWSFSSVLENVANKLMLSAYESAETTWGRITSRATHNNFQIHTKYRIDPTGAFKKVGNDGDLQQIKLGDSTFQNQLETHGGQIGVSRQMMRNDDLGAFGVVPLAFGEFTATTLEHATYLQLLNAPATFFVANQNLLTGGATALSIDSVSAAREMYRNQVTPSGAPLLSSPRMLLVGTALETTAESLWTKERIGASGGAENPHRNTYEPVVSPYLNNTAIRDQDGNQIAGQSATLWFMMNRPSLGGRSTIEMAFLDGVSVPTIRSFDYQPGRLGMTYEAFIDFGVALQERTAAIRVNGA